MAIGNLLGRFLKVDEASLLSLDKHMARVLVELDKQVGLIDSIELEWRGQVTIQCIDFQAIPFRYSSCRRMGHLRKYFHHRVGDTEVAENMEDSTKELYMSESERDFLEETGMCTAASHEDVMETESDSFLGKLKSFCPTLFFKLSSWESDFLGNVVPTTQTMSVVPASQDVAPTISGDLPSVFDRTILTPPFIDFNVTSLTVPSVAPPLEKVLHASSPSSHHVSEPFMDSMIDSLIPSQWSGWDFKD
jgi:hypothetical protein